MAKKTKATKPVTSPAEVTIYTDGSCKSTRGGYAALLTTPQGHSCVLRGNAPNTTNNCMELEAVAVSLKTLTVPSTVTIVTDSEYTMNAVNKWAKDWQKNGWTTASGKPAANREQLEQILELKKTHKVKLEWVRSHQKDSSKDPRIEHNNFCDVQAQKMADRVTPFDA
jgi:ribonuclease HI